MATFTPASGSIAFSQIKSAFANQIALSSYRGLRWYNANQPPSFLYGNFSAGQIKFSDFYGKGGSPQVTPGSFTATRAYVLSVNNLINIGTFNTITFTLVGGGGGVQGSPGNTSAAGSGGSPGGTTTFSTASAAGGAAVLYPGTPSSGSSASLTWNVASNADKIGASISAIVGAGGAGGTGGPNYTLINGTFFPTGTNAATGTSGSDGYINIVWS